ncbi:transporter suffix domain-containing protein [Paenibacillus chibensis]|uniref:Transporter suffix domain-containing protein n=1 Tax=Paenibacillus chibensis TaxID=59846 RepID=A0ABU6PSX1_9BACL|nr:transporter suffix domain-containing protein [Paenibacillus chibensis]
MNEPIPNEKKNKSFLYKLGIVLLLLSLSLWLVPFIIPFTPLPLKLKAGVITGSLVVAEVIFWIGAVLVGKEAAARFKAYLNPAHWRKRGGERKHEE